MVEKENRREERILVPPPPEFGGGTPPPSEWKRMSVKEYDLSQLQKYVQEMMFQMALIGFIHYKWELVPPLVIQIVLNPVKFYQNPLFQIFFLGKKGPEYERPFPEKKSPFAGLMGEPVEQVAQENQGNPPAPGSIVEIPEEDDQSREISSSSSSSSTTTQKESKNQRKKKKKKGVEKVEEVVVEEREKGDLKEKILKNLDEGRVANDETSKEDLLLLD